jgi:hypothetical protein
VTPTDIEVEIEELLAEAASSVEPPAGGSAAILEAAGQMVQAGGRIAGAARRAGRLRREDGIAVPALRGAGAAARWRVVVAAGCSLAVLAVLAVLLLGPLAGGGAPPGGPMLRLRASFGGAGAVSHAAAGAAPSRATLGLSNGDLNVPAATSRGTTTHSSAAAGEPGAAGPQILATGTVTLGVRRAELAGDVVRLGDVASSLAGFVAGTDLTETGRHPGGSVTLRAPASSFDRLIAGAETVGSVQSLQTSSSDVSSQVVDLAARIAALQDARSQLESLLDKAGKISDLLAVEGQIEVTQSQIEQLQAQQRTLGNEVSYSTLTVQLHVVNPPPAPKQQHPRSGGFSAAWHHAVGGFLGGVRATVADLGVVLFSLLGLALLAALAVVLARVGRRVVLRLIA